MLLSTVKVIHPSIHSSIHASIRPFIYLSTHLFIHPSSHSSIHPSIHPSIHLTRNCQFPNCLIANNSVQAANCTDGDVQLIGGSSKYEGRVEVCINGALGSVCSHNWGHQEAGIVCNQIGSMKYRVRYGYASSFGFPINTDVPVLLGYLYCKGHEKTLIECDQSYSYTNFYCNSNYYDVGLICQGIIDYHMY